MVMVVAVLVVMMVDFDYDDGKSAAPFEGMKASSSLLPAAQELSALLRRGSCPIHVSLTPVQKHAPTI